MEPMTGFEPAYSAWEADRRSRLKSDRKALRSNLESIEAGSLAEYRRSRGLLDGGEGKRSLMSGHPALDRPIEV
jgi:hypothetical protein